VANVWLVDIEGGTLAPSLARLGHAVERVPLEKLLSQDSASAPDVAFVSGGATPVVLARKLALHAPATASVLVVPEATAEVTTAILDNGGADVCLEPLTAAAASVLVVRLLRDQRTRARIGYLEQTAARGAQLEDVVTQAPAMKELLERISRIARRSALGPPLSVLLSGETGTGKGLLARVLHFTSRRRDGPFLEVNCAALPASLLEAELFGHERGAFTDAKSARVGLLEAAHGGSLFLDEISHLSLEGQAKLLTALETRAVRRLGSTAERTVDVQIIAATSHDMQKWVAAGHFRPELLHRLTALWFQLPPLRERTGDAALLAERFLERICVSYGLPAKHLSARALEAIGQHGWPGNVRELYHAIERAVLAEDRDTVEPQDLALSPALPTPAEGWPASPEGLSLEDIERAAIAGALEREHGNVTRAAASLKVSRDTLRSRIEKLALVPGDYGAK
jgi:two-component system response regulator AtoC